MGKELPRVKLNREAADIAQQRARDAKVPLATAVSVLVLRGDASFRLADSVAALLDKRLRKISDDVAGLRESLAAMQAPPPAPEPKPKKKHSHSRYDGLPDAVRKQFEEMDREEEKQK